ncbi:MAG: adenosylmethionine decarboxylase [SAR202 cluster bacterium]|nr:adenosylmethionine decarboxylase [SAR202 cluster bacterium]
MNALGVHLLLELQECDPGLLDDLHHVEQAMVWAAEKAGVTIVGKSFHKFSPQGVTGILAIAESHISIHTWPEFGYAAADIFTCGVALDPKNAARHIIEQLRCKRPKLTEIKRGIISQVAASSLVANRT